MATTTFLWYKINTDNFHSKRSGLGYWFWIQIHEFDSHFCHLLVRYVNSSYFLPHCFFLVIGIIINTTYPMKLFGVLNDIILVKHTVRNQTWWLFFLFSHHLTKANKVKALIPPRGYLITHMCPPAHSFLFFKDPDSCYTSPFSLSWELLIFNVYCMISLNFINLNFSPANSSLVRPWELMLQMNFPYPLYSWLSMLQIILNKLLLGVQGNPLKILCLV